MPLMSQTAVALEPSRPSIRRIILGRSVLAAGLLGIIGFGLVFPFPWEGRLSGEVFDLAHAPAFCLALICMVGFLDPAAIGLPARLPTVVKMTFHRVLGMALLLMIVGLAGEYLQKFSGRNPSWLDVAANSAGLLAGLLWVASRGVQGIGRRLLTAAAVVILVAVSMNSIAGIRDCFAQNRSFPLLASFERPREIDCWVARRASISRSDEWSSDGRYSLHTKLNPGKVSGLAMVWFPRDWSNLRIMQMDLHNSGHHPVTLFIKLFDQQHAETGYDHHDRFHVEVTVDAGATQTVSIDLADVRNAPANREMDMRKIWAIEIFGWNLTEVHELHVDHLRLLE